MADARQLYDIIHQYESHDDKLDPLRRQAGQLAALLDVCSDYFFMDLVKIFR